MSTPIILITGASRGIGRGIALACANAGYNLALTCHKNTDQLEEICPKLWHHCLWLHL